MDRSVFQESIRIENYQMITQQKILMRSLENEWATKHLDSQLTKIYVESLSHKYNEEELEFMLYNLESEVKKLSFTQTLFWGIIAILITIILTLITLSSSIGNIQEILFIDYTRFSVIAIVGCVLVFYFYKYYQYLKLERYLIYVQLALKIKLSI